MLGTALACVGLILADKMKGDPFGRPRASRAPKQADTVSLTRALGARICVGARAVSE